MRRFTHHNLSLVWIRVNPFNVLHFSVFKLDKKKSRNLKNMDILVIKTSAAVVLYVTSVVLHLSCNVA